MNESGLILDIMQAAGAHVERQSRIVRVPSDLVDDAIQSAPRSFVLYARTDPDNDLLLENGRVYYGLGGTSEPRYFDYDTMSARQPTKRDMILNTRVGHACEHVDWVQTLCMSGDYPSGEVFFHDFDAIFRNTTKPTVLSVLERPFTRLLLNMAAAAAGGEDSLRERPHCLGMVTPISPLRVGIMNEGILDCIDAGVPIMYAPGPMMGATGPVTVAGTLALTFAEALFGLVLVQSFRRGHPFVFKPDTDVCDMRTTQCTYGSPEQTAGKAAAAQLARFYGLPIYGLGAGVEAHMPDGAAASQAALNMLSNGLAGTTMSQSMGTLCYGSYGNREQLVICDEIAAMVKRVLRGVEVNEETLALDVIRETGHGGSFLTHIHTASHYRSELFFPGLFPRLGYEEWRSQGGLMSHQMAHERVRQILEDAREIELAPGVDIALNEALDTAIRESAHISADRAVAHA